MLFYDVYGDMTGASRWMMRLNALLQVIQTVLWIHDPQLHNPECPTRSKLMHQAGFCCIIHFNGRGSWKTRITQSEVQTGQKDARTIMLEPMWYTWRQHTSIMKHWCILTYCPAGLFSPRVALIQMHCNLCGTSRSWNSLLRLVDTRLFSWQSTPDKSNPVELAQFWEAENSGFLFGTCPNYNKENAVLFTS